MYIRCYIQVIVLLFTARCATYLAATSPMITCIDKTKYTETLGRNDWDIYMQT